MPDADLDLIHRRLNELKVITLAHSALIFGLFQNLASLYGDWRDVIADVRALAEVNIKVNGAAEEDLILFARAKEHISAELDVIYRALSESEKPEAPKKRGKKRK
jgi:hypothetical protein